jgi:hypothetical protein
VTHTRVHTHITFANPWLICTDCGQRAEGWHNPQPCGCERRGWENMPCGHQASISSRCPSWSPVNGCRCEYGIGDHFTREQLDPKPTWEYQR